MPGKKDDKVKQSTQTSSTQAPAKKSMMMFKFNRPQTKPEQNETHSSVGSQNHKLQEAPKSAHSNFLLTNRLETQTDHAQDAFWEKFPEIISLRKQHDDNYAKIIEKLKSFKAEMTSDQLAISKDNLLTDKLLNSTHEIPSENPFSSSNDQNLNSEEHEDSKKESSYSSIDSQEILSLKQKLLDFNNLNLLVTDEAIEEESTLESLHQYLDSLINTLILQLQKNEFKENFLKKAARYKKSDHNSLDFALDYSESGFELLDKYEFIISALKLSMENSFELPKFYLDENIVKHDNFENEVLNKLNSITSKLPKEPIKSTKIHLSLKDAVRIPIYKKYSALLLENQSECWSKINIIDRLLKKIVQSVSNIQIEIKSFNIRNQENNLIKNDFNSGGVFQTVSLSTQKSEQKKRKSVKDLFLDENLNITNSGSINSEEALDLNLQIK